jgi:hypothetical protein
MPLAERWLYRLAMIGFAVFNPLFLPFGLFWSHLHAPIFLFYIAKWNRQGIQWILALILLLALYSTVILATRDVHLQDYLVGVLVLVTSITFATYVYCLIAYRVRNIRRLFSLVLSINAALLVLALALLAGGYEDCCWIPAEFGDFPRLQLAFYEPSHLAYVCVPFVLYVALEMVETRGRRGGWLVVIGATLLALTQSLSVIGFFVPVLVITSMHHLLRVLISFRVLFIAVGLAVLLAFLSSGIVERLQATFLDGDHSGQVRVIDSTLIAFDIIHDQRAWLLGVGFGQLKYFVEDFAADYRGFAGNRLPNSFASTVATVGFLGLAVKWLILLLLAKKTRVFNDDYARGLFTFAFLYQFVGSYFLNINEFVLFAIAFGHAMKRRLNEREAFICKGIGMGDPTDDISGPNYSPSSAHVVLRNPL